MPSEKQVQKKRSILFRIKEASPWTKKMTRESNNNQESLDTTIQDTHQDGLLGASHQEEDVHHQDTIITDSLLDTAQLDTLPTSSSNSNSTTTLVNHGLKRSARIQDAQVEPLHFEKIQLVGKGDVGKVYLVRHKDSGKFYAMKGNITLANERSE